MPYSAKSNKNGTEYYLYSVPSANGTTRLYHFAKDANKSDGKSRAESDLPAGYEVSENSNTGLPILKKKAVASFPFMPCSYPPLLPCSPLRTPAAAFSLRPAGTH